MTREYIGLIGDGRAVVKVEYEIDGDRDDFDIDITAIFLGSIDVIDCLTHEQIREMEREIYQFEEKLMTGMADI